MTEQATAITQTGVLIVGAGFAGIGLAIQLRRCGFTDFILAEQAADLGGVWRDNTYPGAGCDVPSPLYSFSYARHQRWSRRYAKQRDIHAYLRRTANTFGVHQHIQFRTKIVSADFDAESGQWRVGTAAGQQFYARVLVPAVGQLSRPAYPSIPGTHTFRGRSFHSAEWEHDYDLTGKRVAVVGTGASAIQFVPQIQPQVAQLTLFQRSAQYIMPKRDHGYGNWPHKAFQSFPPLQSLDRLGFWLYAEFAQQCMSKWQKLIPVFRWQANKTLRQQVSDPELRAKLQPDYQLGCKRVLFSNEYYPALSRPNVTVVTEQVEAITETGISTATGHYDVDAIIYATGFATLDMLAPLRIRGVGGYELTDAWHTGARAYLGMAVPDFPNLFIMYGPNTNLGGNSVIHMLESQARYISNAVRWLTDHPGRYLDVDPSAEHRWDNEVQQRLTGSVWARCQSWYRNSYGRVVANWPGRTWEYRRRTRHIDLADYRTVEVGTVSATAATQRLGNRGSCAAYAGFPQCPNGTPQSSRPT